MSSLIKLINVSKIYQVAKTASFALKNIHLEINQGEMLAIVGASGSGKSTLMNIMGFLDQATSGDYLFNQENVSHLPHDHLAHIRNQKIGFIFQAFFLLPRLSVLKNVMLPLFYRGTPAEDAKREARILLEKVGMADYCEHRPLQLSGGQQQRVAIARALVGNPDVILADEPTGALDSKTGHDCLRLLQNLHRQEGRTIVIITHDINVSKQCERVITIQDGKITEQ